MSLNDVTISPFSNELIKPVICTTVRRIEACQEWFVRVHDTLGSRAEISENKLILRINF